MDKITNNKDIFKQYEASANKTGTKKGLEHDSATRDSASGSFQADIKELANNVKDKLLNNRVNYDFSNYGKDDDNNGLKFLA